MRTFLVMLALVVSASPAFAQWLMNPGPVKPAPKAVRHHHRHYVPHRKEFRHEKAAAPIPRRKAATAIPASKVPLPTPAPDSATAKAAPAQKTAKSDAAASGAFAGIPPEERLKIRAALYWHGDFDKAEPEEDPAEAAIKSFQKRNREKVTGVLTEDQRKELIAANERYRREYGWRVVVDPATGIRIGLPTRLVPDAHDAPHGTRWSSPHDAVQIETFRLKGPKTDLAELYRQERRRDHREVEKSNLDDDGFFIRGMQGLKDFAVRAKLRDGEVRGFTILYDQMMETIVEPVMVAMASAFAPFPEQPLPLAALSRRVEYGTGLIVSADGDIVTARRAVRGCEVIVADGLGDAVRVAEDANDGLALLRVYGAAGLTPLAPSGAAAKPDEVTLVGIPDPQEQDGRKKLKEIKARLVDGHAIVPRQPVPMAGFSGAAALDGKGDFVGLLEPRDYRLASNKPAVPPLRLVRAGTIREFLAKHHVAVADGSSADARAAAMRIICVRK
ncbi:MAG: serine protease [Pseudolabrys sp.]